MLTNGKLQRIIEFSGNSNRATPANMELAEAYMQELLRELLVEKSLNIKLGGMLEFAGKESEELVADMGELIARKQTQVDIIVDGLGTGRGR